MQLRGRAERRIVGIATLNRAGPEQLSFLANPRYLAFLAGTKAGAVILAPEHAAQCPVDCLISDQPYLCFARASQLFAPPSQRTAGVHPSAVLAATASIHPDAQIAANCVIGENVEIDAGVSIGAGTVIGDNCRIGRDSELFANVTLYQAVILGERVRIHSATVIGSDGFGYAPSQDGWVKIAQLGSVHIGNDVEIGACCAIDRGALDDTIIADGVIIDNQVQIAHNVQIGKNTAIAGCTGIAGSTRIGARCTIAGGVGILGHLEIADDVHITAMSLVNTSIHSAGSFSAGTTLMDSKSWRKSAVRFKQLEKIHARLLKLEKSQQ